MTAQAERGAADAGILFQAVTGHWIARALWVVAHLRVADAVSEQGSTIDEVAAATGTRSDRLGRVLAALSTIGIFERRDAKRFAHNGCSRLLRSDHPQSMRDFVTGMLGGEIYEAFDAIEAAVKQDTSAFTARHGAPPFEYYLTRPVQAQQFANAMTANTRPIDAAVAGHDFAPFRHVVDVGGSNGTLMRAVIARHPQARGTLFDLPHVAAAAEAGWRGDGDVSRLTAVGGSFFDEIDVSGDLYLLKNVLHDWSDAESGVILSRIRTAMQNGARLAVIEMVLPDDGSPHPGWAADLAMLALTDKGRERTLGEFAMLLGDAGFTIDRVTPATPHVTIVEAGAAS